ncbi:galanin receptor type 1-like [Strongylocentrotus purpuratus]|nr:galanin receptor type 1-like [Strongylocentrotus purpuratus]
MAAAVTAGSSVSYTTPTIVNHSCTFVLLDDECDLTILLSTIMFFTTLFNIVFGVIANFLVIGVILASREMWTIPSIYITNLAISDVMALLFVAGSNCYEYYIGAFQVEEYQSTQTFVFYMELVTVMATVAMMIALTVDRFFAIVYPLRSQKYRTKNRAIKICVAVWIFSFCFGGTYFGAPIESKNLEAWKEPNAKYLISLGAVFTYIIPLLIIFGCYTAIMRTIWKNRISDERASDQTRKRRNKQKHAVLRASMLVVVLFAVIQGFYIATFLWIAFGGSLLVDPSLVIIVFNVAQGLYQLNSLINPFLYALSHEKFYHSIWRVISCSSTCCRWKTSLNIHLPRAAKPNGVERPSEASEVNGGGEWKSQGVYNLAYEVNTPEVSTRL